MENTQLDHKRYGECLDDYDMWEDEDDVDKYPMRPHFISYLKKELKIHKEKQNCHIERF